MTLAPPSSSADRLEQLLYQSRCLIETDSALQMSDILAEARPANARDGITGALTAVDGRFVQIIEGAPEALDGLMRRLARDRRHADIVIRERRRIDRRTFGDWDMVSPRLTPQEIGMLALLLEDPRAKLDAFGGVLTTAVAHQDAVLRGGRPDARLEAARRPDADAKASEADA